MSRISLQLAFVFLFAFSHPVLPDSMHLKHGQHKVTVFDVKWQGDSATGPIRGKTFDWNMMCIKATSKLPGLAKDMKARANVHFARYQYDHIKKKNEIKYEWLGVINGIKCFPLERFWDKRVVVLASAIEGPVEISIGANACSFEDVKGWQDKCKTAKRRTHKLERRPRIEN